MTTSHDWKGRGQELFGIELLDAWKAFRDESGGSLMDLADELGLTYTALNSRLVRARKELGRGGEKVRIPRGGEVAASPPLLIPEQVEDKISIEARANTMELESASKQIRTLEELIEVCKIDLEVWQIDRHVINKWAGLARAPDGSNVVVPLFQVKAWLSKRHPEPVEFVIQPVQFSVAQNLTPVPSPIRGGERLRKALLVPDMHFGFKKDLRTGVLTPFHDRAALDVVLQVAGLEDWDDVVFLGDVMDFAELSDKFLRSPEFYWTVQPAIVEAAWWLGKFRMAASGANLRLLQGNHDLRAETAVITHLISAYDLRPADELQLPPALSVPRLLGLEKLGIEWVDGYPDSAVWLNDQVRLIHGDVARGNPGATVQSVVQKSPVNVVMGHIHRIELVTRSDYNRGGKIHTVTTMCPGCLCRVDGVVPGHKKTQNWQQGFGVAYYDQRDYVSLAAAAILNGRAVWSGKVLEAREQVERLREETGWEF